MQILQKEKASRLAEVSCFRQVDNLSSLWAVHFGEDIPNMIIHLGLNFGNKMSKGQAYKAVEHEDIIMLDFKC